MTHLSGLVRIMAPVLQTLIALAVRVLLRLLLLCQMSFAVGSYAAYVRDVILVVFGRILSRVLAEDLDDFAAAALEGKKS